MVIDVMTEPVSVPLEPRERTASDVLLGAARYIEEHGWHQFGDGSPSSAWFGGGDRGPVCIEGGLAGVGVGRGSPLFRDCEARLRASIAEPFQFLWTWNDAPDRTEAEVIRALRDAAR